MRYLRFYALLAAASTAFVAGCEPSGLDDAEFGRQTEQLSGNDHYSIAAGMTLEVAAPGVQANDSIRDDLGEVELVDKPKWGRLQFNADGSFIYTPKYKFAGNDIFTYR